ncbi:LexA family protein [Streptomyces sp. NPDC005047]
MGRHRVDYLTPRQEEILRISRAVITDEGDAPTVAEIAAAVDLSPSTVHYQLGELETKGANRPRPRPPARHPPRMTTAGRYHLVLVADGRDTLHGWWPSEPVARSKFSAWVGRHGSRPAATITLIDDETGALLTTWPDRS